MKKFISLLIIFSVWFLFAANLKAKEIYTYCLVTTSDLRSAKLAPEENKRFAGKEIKLIILYPVEEGDKNLIVDISDESDSALSLITGMYGLNDMQEFKEVVNGIRYTNEIEAKGDKEGEMVTYSYKNFIRIVDGKPTSLYAMVDQTGFSFNTYKFQIDCKDQPHTASEKTKAKKTFSDLGSFSSEEFQDLIDKMHKEKKAKENLKKN